MSETSKKRVPNFTSTETELLTSLVKRYASVLENKKTDVVNNQLKEETWGKLADDFNSTGICQRDSKTLRAKYENIKKSLKRKYGGYRRSLYQTGGGPPQDLNLTHEEEIIMELAGPSVEGLPARFDSDTIPEFKTITIPPSQVIAQVEVPDDTDVKKSKQHVVNTPEGVDCTPNRFLLKRKRSTPLIHRNPESFTNTMERYGNLSIKKQELADVQIKCAKDKINQQKIEHEEKIKQEKIEHELRCEIMRLDIMLKNKMLKQ